MEKQKVIVTSRPAGQTFDIFRNKYDLIVPQIINRPFSRAELEKLLPLADAVIAASPLPYDLMVKCKNTKVICADGAGTNHIDIAAATVLKIPIYNIPQMTAWATAELAFALLLNLFRHVSQLDRYLHENKLPTELYFENETYLGHSLAGRTIGLFGLGHIGKIMARFCDAFQMQVLYCSRTKLPYYENNAQYLPFYEMLPRCDALSIHAPLTEQTQGLFNREVFAKMKKGALIINTARGAIINHTDLIRAIEAEHLGGAALDVFPDEPNLPKGLTECDRVLLTPHIGTLTIDARENMSAALYEIIDQVCASNTYPQKNLINPEVFQS